MRTALPWGTRAGQAGDAASDRIDIAFDNLSSTNNDFTLIGRLQNTCMALKQPHSGSRTAQCAE